ncbi:hypothetical protein EOD41_12740 [Mucilaginibacter limnophilus]|uniref:Uncharacterized protein n=1 Tax=Mucilaginibacter limnophilus TaxID=1932778 RepID=A0A3S2UKF6_9SPHI|nr:hypothetical protein [Mucilaginibacter limnophilus]RVU00344.1 hypothetical protein EOD41_12740 [Mucilaginibacter limnophilus]
MKKIVSLLVVLLTGVHAFCQQPTISKPVADTVYYFLDLDAIPVADRMISADTAARSQVFYHIYCPCLKDNLYPVLRSNVTKKTKFVNFNHSKLKFIALRELIELIKTNDDVKFNDRHIIYLSVVKKMGFTKIRHFTSAQK